MQKRRLWTVGVNQSRVIAGGTLLALIGQAVKTMLRLKPEQRAVLADKVPDVVNIIAGAIVIGFFVGEPRFSSGLLMAGIVLWAAAIAFAVTIAEHK